MLLEDFFTLSEMKDGLGTRSRVKDLLSLMQEQKDCTIGNGIDAVRQWSTVAKILAATDTKDCLECFIQLDGLWFFNYWLQEAQKHGSDGDDSVRNLINDILGALDRLPVNQEVYVSSGIWCTLKQVISQDIVLQEKVRNLLSKWEFPTEETGNHHLEKHVSWHIVELKANATSMEVGVQAVNNCYHIASSKQVVNSQGCAAESTKKESDHSDAKTHPVGSEIGGSKEMEVSASNRRALPSASNLGCATVISEDVTSLASSNVSNPGQESVSIVDESSVCIGTKLASTANCSSPSAWKKTSNNQPNVCDVKDISDVLKNREDVYNLGLNLGKTDQKVECVFTSQLSNSSSKESENSPTKASEAQWGGAIADQLPTFMNNRKEQGMSFGKQDDPSETALQDSSGETSGDAKKISTHYSKSNEEVDSRNRYGYSSILHRRTEIELEFGDDALEVAVQVALEAEREVADREECSSSQQGKSDGEVVDSGCSNLDENKSEQSNSYASPDKLDLSNGTSPGKNCSRIAGNPEFAAQVQGAESQKPAVTQLSLGNPTEKRGIFDLNEGMSFDLNEGIFDHSPAPVQKSLPAPVAIVASINGSPNFPVMPRLFHGETGWRGSAATSAFRPASPKKATEYEISGSNNEKACPLLIDLNIADHGDYATGESTLTKPLGISELPSRDSSSEVGSKRTAIVTLDLNCPGDDDAFANPSPHGVHHQTGPSRLDNCFPPSSFNHNPFRCIDLNDTPVAFDVCVPVSMNKSCKALPTSESCEAGDPDVVILGSRMSTVRREPFNNCWQSSMRGLNVDSSMVGQPSSVLYPYMPAHGYSYSNISMGSNAFSLHSSPYGPGSFPYMIDSRGATVVPQVLGNSTGPVGPPPPKPSIGATTNSLGFGVAFNHPGWSMSGSSSSSFDLNSGIPLLDGSSREPGSSERAYLQGHNGMTGEEHSRYGPHFIASLGSSLKRKEPDPSWEPHTMSYKQMPSWR